MSLNSTLNAGVSGLTAQASAMAAISDNIANVNTVGYKGTDTKFSTLVIDGGSSTDYVAGGVEAKPQSLIDKQGLLQSSASGTDLAIDGSGFFVVRPNTGTQTGFQFTRAGSFSPDANGYLKNDAGLYLQGWKLDGNGNVIGGTTNDTLAPVRLSDINGTAEPTDKISIRANLSSQQTALDPTYLPYTPGSMASGATPAQFTRSFDVYDQQGTSHRIMMSFAKTGNNSWAAEVYTDPSETSNGATPLVSGTVSFNPDGSLDVANSSPQLFQPINMGTTAPGITWMNGAGAVPIDLGLGSQNGLDGLTQFGSDTAMISSSVNGAMLGNVQSVQVSNKGVVSAVFDNGTIRALYELPLATVQNPDGMTRLNANAYQQSAVSGTVSINKAGDTGGTITANALEGSNVDLAEQFTKMITTQRAYSASGKIITTADEMMQELVQLKR